MRACRFETTVLPFPALVAVKDSPARNSSEPNIYRFAEHLNEGKCGLCMALSRQWDKELQMMKFLRDSGN
jgi:hypothetical protein